MLKVTFGDNPKTKKFVLSLFGKNVDKENYIVERDNGKRILGYNGQELTLDDFGVIKNGSEIYGKGDIVSLVDFYKKYLAK